MHEALKKLLESLGRNTDETDEEQKMGIKTFKALLGTFGGDEIPNWLFCEEWEDSLVPVRLPKGMAKQLKQMDEARAELMATDDCEKREAKANCPILKRNPSELLLTFLLKLAVAKVTAEIKIKEVMTDA